MPNHKELHEAITSGEPLNVVKTTYQLSPGELSRDVLLDACEHGAPGVLSFLATSYSCPGGTNWESIVRVAIRRFFCSSLGGEEEDGPVDRCPIEELSIQFEKSNSSYQAQVATMELLRYLPNISKLILFDVVDPKGLFCNEIANLIKCTPLRELRVAFDYEYTPPKSSIQELLDAVKDTSSLKELWLFMGKSSSQTKTLCLNRLVKILKHYNSPLERVVLDFPGVYDKDQLELKQQLRYQAALNRCGRERVRDPSATILDLVEVLCKTTGPLHGSKKKDRASPVSEGSVLFGLLRETPSLWSTASVLTTTHSATNNSIIRETLSSATGRRKRASMAMENEGPDCKTMKVP